MFLFMCAALIALSVRALAPWRTHIFLVLSLGFVGVQHRFAAPSLAVLAIAVAIHYLTLRWMLRLPTGTPRASVFWAWLGLTLAGFVVVKHYDWLTDPFVPRTLIAADLSTIGFSFLLFRQIHLAVDVRDGMTESLPRLP